MATQSGIWGLQSIRNSLAIAQYSPGVEIGGITGDVYAGGASNIVINGNNFGLAATVRFTVGGSATEVGVTPDSNTQITVAVPSAVANNPVGTTVFVAVIASGEISSTSSLTIQYLAPTGGTITTSGLYTVHTFTTSGTFSSNSLATDVEYLVVAGGAASAWSTSSGGGGAGGFRTNVPGSTSGGGAPAEPTLSISAGTNYTATVGAGGVAADQVYIGQNGFNSVFGSITSLGGGGGAGSSVNNVGASGGSGGGGSARTSSGNAGGAGTAGQGYGGGVGYNTGSQSNTAGGGGGGAAAAGVGSGSTPNGGAGRVSSISGSSVTYAGGGGGGTESRTRGAGGVGGGGNGAQYPDTTPAQNGTANTGGGAGGGYTSRANGGSGIVIVRYLTPT